MTALSICIPTVASRASLLSRLLFTIDRQWNDQVEVLIARGHRPMGDKLNDMFADAHGRYVVAVDDDDMLAPHYLRALPLDADVDFIGYDILWLEDGLFAGLVKHSLTGDPWWRSLDRAVSPKCPIRTEIARSVPFGNEYTADRVWSMKVYGACEHGCYVPEALYVYDHWNAHMVGTDPSDGKLDRPQREVGRWPHSSERFTWLA